MSEPKVIYLGPACEADTGDGRTWAEDNPWPDCECGHRAVQYVLGDTFDRTKAERDALQLRLNAADQRIDDLGKQLAAVEQSRRYWFDQYRTLEKATSSYTEYVTQPGESLMGIANRQLKSSERWIEIRDLNAHAFPDMLHHSYYPVGTTIKLPA